MIPRAILLALLVSAVPAKSHELQGPGLMNCAKFAKAYQNNPQTMEVMFYSWAQGFWSALNLVARSNGNPTRELGSDDNVRVLRQFCAENPLKDYMDGVVDLYPKLPTAK